ncbi:MAG: beta-lactamase family protein [Lachnospiraceae bacterium]|nr:beta-lactamase family protein [Lachnospiraceae bacterium]
MHKGDLIQEEYFSPYEKGRMHRMFSITKSFTSLAVGALIAEEKLSLSDPICKYFPEYTPADADPFLTTMTVQDLLMMRTCHKATTYKINASAHWVQSFFTTAPDHKPGMIFKYDTSAAHTLAALVKKVSGQKVLDYLRNVFPDDIGFSKDAYILDDPFGCEIGGSGMIAYPEDLLKVGTFLLSLINGTFEYHSPTGFTPDNTAHKKDNDSNEKENENRDVNDNSHECENACNNSESIKYIYDEAFYERYAEYVRDAVSLHSPTLHEGKTIDEMQGYGYQFWQLRDNGIMMYGMGGQYMVLYPEAELIFITTADTQSVQGGTQYILDEIRRVALSIAPELNAHISAPAKATAKNCISSYYGSYRLMPNAGTFHQLIFTENELILEAEEKRFVFPYGIKEAKEATEPGYGQKIYTTALPQPDGSLYLNTQILDEYVGSIHFMMNKKDAKITLSLRKVEESLYKEFNCFLNGEKIPE